MRITLAVAVGLFFVTGAVAQQPEKKEGGQVSAPAACPMHDSHSQMNERGEKGMGFSQTATTHHFVLRADGGVIQVEANNSSDHSTRSNIRMHLDHIAKAFQRGDFNIPLFVHDAVPPGVPEMKQLQKSIQYSFEETPNGGRVLISSSDEEAIHAIHQFLRFQIEEHKTGDPENIR